MWRQWSMAALPTTLDALQITDQSRVVVVGRKSFGHLNRSALAATHPDLRAGLRNPVPEDLLTINRTGRDLGLRFLDVHEALCGGADALSCPIFDGNGQLLSHDGGHLTEDGARYLADRLAPQLSEIITGS